MSKIKPKHVVWILFFLVFIPILKGFYQSDFISEQRKYPRVREAINKKEVIIRNKLSNHYIDLHELNVMMVAYKAEKRLDIFIKKKLEVKYRKFQSYPICDISGVMGPKRKEGDLQTPEGFYHIDLFNPTSSYHLSFRISYPNLSDKRKSNAQNLGGDIYVHGLCATVGCLPMTNEIMDEIYLLAICARNNGQNIIPFYIFPFEMSEDNMVTYKVKYKTNKELITFWENLKVGYDLLCKDVKKLDIKIMNNGDYIFN